MNGRSEHFAFPDLGRGAYDSNLNTQYQYQFFNYMELPRGCVHVRYLFTSNFHLISVVE